MTEISLAWLLTKVTAPVVGATKKHHIDGAVKAVDLTLSDDEIRYLEESYQPHKLVGVMAQNTPQTQAKSRHRGVDVSLPKTFLSGFIPAGVNKSLRQSGV